VVNKVFYYRPVKQVDMGYIGVTLLVGWLRVGLSAYFYFNFNETPILSEKKLVPLLMSLIKNE